MSVPSADADDSFAVLRPRLFGIAYGITASVGDAQDVCQDAWLRWAGVDHSRIEHEEAYLVRLVSNAAIDRLRAAQARRETYVGPFLPEPLLTELADTPLAAAERADELTFAFLVLLDQLSATERRLMSEGIESMSLNPDTVVETWLHLAKVASAKASV